MDWIDLRSDTVTRPDGPAETAPVAWLDARHDFGDAAILRRTMVTMGLVTRTQDGRVGTDDENEQHEGRSAGSDACRKSQSEADQRDAPQHDRNVAPRDREQVREPGPTEPLQVLGGRLQRLVPIAPIMGNVVIGIAAALLDRERTGRAHVVDVSLLATGMWAMGQAMALSLLLETPWQAPPAEMANANPLVRNYATKDERDAAEEESEQAKKEMKELEEADELPKDPADWPSGVYIGRMTTIPEAAVSAATAQVAASMSCTQTRSSPLVVR